MESSPTSSKQNNFSNVNILANPVPMSSNLTTATSSIVSQQPGTMSTVVANTTTSASNKLRLNLSNQSYLIVPTNNVQPLTLSSTGMSTIGSDQSVSTNNNVSNLLASNPNAIVGNKGKIMILTTGAVGVTNFSSGSSLSTSQAPFFSNVSTTTKMLANAAGGPISVTKKPLTSMVSASPEATIHLLSPEALSKSNNIGSMNAITLESKTALKSWTKSPLISPKSIGVTATSVHAVTDSVAASNNSVVTSISSTMSNHHHHHHPNILNNTTNDSIGNSPTQSLKCKQSLSGSQAQLKSQTNILNIQNMDIVENHEEGFNDIEIEIRQLNKKGVKEHSEVEPIDIKKLLFSDENLDRDSPELWPEQVPGVVDFIAATQPVFEYVEDELFDEDAQNNQLANLPNQYAVAKTETDSGLGSAGGSSESSNRKISRTFDFTNYGLSLSIPFSNGTSGGDSGSVESDSDNDHDTSSLINGNVESTENSSRNSPIDGCLNERPSCNSAIFLEHLQPNTPFGLSIKPKPQIQAPKISKQQLQSQAAPSTPSQRTISIPEWQRDLDEEEVAMLYGFGSLTTSALMDKVKEIKNLAYQLGLEEEREMARARYLNILVQDERQLKDLEMTTNGGYNLSKDDFALVESKSLINNRNTPLASSNPIHDISSLLPSSSKQTGSNKRKAKV